MPYGIDDARRTHIGALDLLNVEQGYSLFATGESIGGQESDTRSEHAVSVKRESCDSRDHESTVHAAYEPRVTALRHSHSVVCRIQYVPRRAESHVEEIEKSQEKLRARQL